MTGRGTGIFQECRLALVRIGAPAVDPLIAAAAGEEPRHPGDGGEAEVRGAAAGRNAGRRAAQGRHPARRPARQEGGPGADGAPAQEGARRRAPLGADRARLHRDAAGGRRDPGRSEGRQGRPGRARLGRRRALPVGRPARGADADGDRQVRLRDDAAARRRPTCAPARPSRSPRIAGKETYEPFKALAEKETAAQGVFGMALDRMQVANECGRRPRLLRQEAERSVVDARREGGVRHRVLGRRQEGRAAAAGAR